MRTLALLISFLTVVCVSSTTYNTVNWTLTVPNSSVQLSKSTKHMLKMFNEPHGTFNLSELRQENGQLQVFIADGTVSNWTKKLTIVISFPDKQCPKIQKDCNSKIIRLLYQTSFPNSALSEQFLNLNGQLAYSIQYLSNQKLEILSQEISLILIFKRAQITSFYWPYVIRLLQIIPFFFGFFQYLKFFGPRSHRDIQVFSQFWLTIVMGLRVMVLQVFSIRAVPSNLFLSNLFLMAGFAGFYSILGLIMTIFILVLMFQLKSKERIGINIVIIILFLCSHECGAMLAFTSYHLIALKTNRQKLSKIKHAKMFHLIMTVQIILVILLLMLEGKSHPGKCPYVFSEVMSDAIKIEEWTFALLLFNGLLNLAAIFDYRVDMSWFSKTIKKCIKQNQQIQMNEFEYSPRELISKGLGQTI